MRNPANHRQSRVGLGVSIVGFVNTPASGVPNHHWLTIPSLQNKSCVYCAFCYVNALSKLVSLMCGLPTEQLWRLLARLLVLVLIKAPNCWRSAGFLPQTMDDCVCSWCISERAFLVIYMPLEMMNLSLMKHSFIHNELIIKKKQYTVEDD